jgi:hypothetical protein
MIQVGDIIRSVYAPDYYGVVININKEDSLTTYYSIQWFSDLQSNPDHKYLESELTLVKQNV